MNILFVNYGGPLSNSMNHIMPYANELSRRGHSCTIAVETKDATSENTFESPLYSLLTYDEILQDKALPFPDSSGADIIHAWTPRENVRIFTERYQERHPSSTLIIHLEDNEDSILESYYRRSIESLRFPSPSDPEPEWNPRICHPSRYRRFLWQADAITTLAPSLVKLLPTPKPTQNIAPILLPIQAQATLSPDATKQKFALPADKKLIVYPGGVTSNNREDIRNLYLAVKLLNDAGTPAIVAKTGPNCSDLEKSFEFPIEEVRIDLGYLEKQDITNLLHAADILIQPGKTSEFNLDRLPCKIPEFLLSGRLSLIPHIYSYLVPTEEPCCQFIDGGSPQNIAKACLEAFAQPEQTKTIAERAAKFAAQHFGAEHNTTILEQFYQSARDLAETRKRPPLDLDESFRTRFLETRKSFKASENEIVGLNQDIRSFQQERTHHLAEIESLETEADTLKRANDELQNRLERTRKTVSWKITTPLRFLRRKLIDPLSSSTIQLPPASQPEIPETPNSDSIAKAEDRPPAGHPCYHKNYYDFTLLENASAREKRNQLNERIERIASKPSFSILLPTYNVDEIWLRKCIDSVLDQDYPHWQLCIADDASSKPHVRETIESYLKKDSRIQAIFRPQNGHISAASNSAFTLATGEYIALLDHDDEIPPQALAHVALAIAENPSAKLIYTDEDKIDEAGIRHDPHMKTDWNYEFFLGCNMISHFGVYEYQAFKNAGGFRVGFEGAQDWDLALRVIETIRPNEIIHIPEILYHWRSIQGSTAAGLDQKNYAHPAQKRALTSHLQRIGAKALAESVQGVNWRIVYDIPTPAPKVTIVIPTRDRLDILQACVESILIKTSYPNFEILIVDNDSTDPPTIFFLENCHDDPRIKVLRIPGEFNYSRINNQAILTTDSPLICLLNNDIEITDGSWLTEMARHALREEIGVVGAKLLFPHDHIQHCGIILGIYDIAGHAFKFLHKNDNGHIGRAKLVSAYSAVTGACMLFKRSLWEKLGGLDETNLPISYNDVDFCLRANEAGFRTILTPFATLYHKESESRGSEQTDEAVLRFEQESEYMRRKWKSTIERDPFYNPNLTRGREDFSYRGSE